MNLHTKLASTLLQLRGPLGPLVPREQAKLMTAKEIVARFQFDHYPIPKAHGGTDHPTNVEPRLIAEHRAKTRLQDIPMIAKSKRIRAKHLAHLERMRMK